MEQKLYSLAIVVPCFNEQAVLPAAIESFTSVLRLLITKNKISSDSKVYFVDDGSHDRTWEMLEAYSSDLKCVIGVKLSRNKGHQNAVFAGLMQTTEDMVVSIDADLQDDPSNIELMVDKFLAGCEVVYGVRAARTTDTFFKRFTAENYYRLMRSMGVDLVFNHADFRLMSRRVVEALKQYEESNLFLRGIVREIGFKSDVVTYDRQERKAGDSKYPLRKMLSFAWDGISSFSTVPLRIITLVGFFSSILSLLTIAWVVFVALYYDNSVPGWASILVPLLFIGSIQLLCLGVVGEYIAKLYKEVKRRPRYHLDAVAHGKSERVD